MTGAAVPVAPLPPPPPVVLAYGIGVDSTALLIEKHARGEAPDLVLTADTSVEKPATYEYLDVIRPWMRDRGIRFELVSYVPRRFKHWPPYFSLLENCLTNAAEQVARRVELQPQIQEGAAGQIPVDLATSGRRMGARAARRPPDRL